VERKEWITLIRRAKLDDQTVYKWVPAGGCWVWVLGVGGMTNRLGLAAQFAYVSLIR